MSCNWAAAILSVRQAVQSSVSSRPIGPGGQSGNDSLIRAAGETLAPGTSESVTPGPKRERYARPVTIATGPTQRVLNAARTCPLDTKRDRSVREQSALVMGVALTSRTALSVRP